MRIGELAELAGVTTRTVRHYHQIGLLPEPARAANGYRDYRIEDAVRLVRARRLAGLGMPLDAVAAALAAGDPAPPREILAGLDAALAAQERRIARRRARIAELLARDGDEPGQAELRRELEALAGDHPGLERELHLLELAGQDDDGQAVQAYRRLLTGPDGQALLALGRRFEALAGSDPADPEVDRLAGELAGALADAVADPGGRSGGPGPLLQAAADELAPAQARCLQLVATLAGGR